MKRQLKFRAFFKDDMHYNHSVSLSLNGIVHYLDTDGEWKCDIEGNGEDIGVIVMQYTGLNDRHGTEIYEGDIVRILYSDWASKSDKDSRTLEQYLTDIAEVKVVIWEFNGFYVSNEVDGYAESMSYGKHGYIEVIGNIYQNAELLKEAVK
jgi:uncharacterized phage protein (TIGR01671 family)